MQPLTGEDRRTLIRWIDLGCPVDLDYDPRHPERRGFVITFIIEEGEQYRVGTVDIRSNVRTLSPALLQPRVRVYSGDVYNAEAMEKSVEDMTIEGARQGFAFISVRPRAGAGCACISSRSPRWRAAKRSPAMCARPMRRSPSFSTTASTR